MSKNTKQTFETFNHLLLILSTLSLLLSYNHRASANIFVPNMATSSFDLSIGHDQCKAKAIEVASFVLAEYVTEEDDNIFRLRGRTSRTRAMLVCMKKNPGVRFVVIAASNGSEDEYESVRDRVSQFMKS